MSTFLEDQRKALKQAGFNRVKILDKSGQVIATESAYKVQKMRESRAMVAELQAAEKAEFVKLFTTEDLAELESAMVGTPRLHVNADEMKRILKEGAENATY